MVCCCGVGTGSPYQFVMKNKDGKEILHAETAGGGSIGCLLCQKSNARIKVWLSNKFSLK